MNRISQFFKKVFGHEKEAAKEAIRLKMPIPQRKVETKPSITQRRRQKLNRNYFGTFSPLRPISRARSSGSRLKTLQEAPLKGIYPFNPA